MTVLATAIEVPSSSSNIWSVVPVTSVISAISLEGKFTGGHLSDQDLLVEITFVYPLQDLPRLLELWLGVVEYPLGDGVVRQGPQSPEIMFQSVFTKILLLKHKPSVCNILRQLQIHHFGEVGVGLGPGVDHHGVHALHYLCRYWVIS